MVNDKKCCRRCGSVEIRKRGFYKQKQRYQCKSCGVVFVLNIPWAERAFDEYCFANTQYKQIGAKYGKSTRTVQRNFDKLSINYFLAETADKHINLVFDGTYFGWDLCYLVFRAERKTFYFKQCAETASNIACCLNEIERLGYTFKSFTVDGKKGVIQHLKSAYPKVPIQYCQFHQKKTIKRYLTQTPKTPCGQAIKNLTQGLCRLTKPEFLKGLEEIKTEFKSFLIERNESGQYMHRRVRSAIRSLTNNANFLFTYQDFSKLKIPNTTNTCEGYFSQLKRHIRTHPGLTMNRLKRVVERMFCASPGI